MTTKPTKTVEEELTARFWETHHSHSLSKDDWTLEKSVDALLPMVIRDAYKQAIMDARSEVAQYSPISAKATKDIIKALSKLDKQ